MNRSKRTSISLLLGALLTVMLVGGTLAYLTTTTETRVNNFTFLGDSDINATLTEPAWDPAKGLNLTPGTVVPKDPIITNTSTNNLEVYAAMRVTFKNGSGVTLTSVEHTRLMTLVTINWATSATWTPVGTAGPVTIYNYTTKLASTGATSVTAPLFTTVTINSNVTTADMEWLKTTLGGFSITIDGAAVQASGYATWNLAQTELNALFI